MDKIQIQVDVSRRISLLRRIERLLEGPKITEHADDVVIMTYINTYDADGLEQYLYATMSQELEVLSLRQLRSKAKTYGIPYYTLLNRIELIKAIHESRRRNEERNSGSKSSGDTVRQDHKENDSETTKSSSSFP